MHGFGEAVLNGEDLPTRGRAVGILRAELMGVRGARPPALAWVGAAGVEGVAGQPAGLADGSRLGGDTLFQHSFNTSCVLFIECSKPVFVPRQAARACRGPNWPADVFLAP